MDELLTQLQGDVDTARAVYAAARADLQSLLTPLFQEPEEATSIFISKADEFGVERAMEDLRLPFKIGPFHDAAIEIPPATRDAIGERLDVLMDAHERLDAVTAAREDHLQGLDPDHVRVINFDGREFEVDVEKRELRAVVDPGDRYEMPVMAAQEARDPQGASLTEQVRGETPLAQPMPERDRTRGR